MLPYVELHARSAFSFLRGGSIPEGYVAQLATLIEKGLAAPAMALTDVDGVYGSVRFHSAAKEYGIRAHVGAEVSGGAGRYTLLCQSRAGYQNLCRLITRCKLRTGIKHAKAGDEARATFDDLAEFAEGLICLTGGEEGPLAQEFARDEVPRSSTRLLAIYGRDNVFVEVHAIWTPRRKSGFRPPWRSPAHGNCRWWQPMAYVMPRRQNGASSMYSPACGTKRPSPMRDVYWSGTLSGT